ncbi:MAG: aminoacyl-tRNA hydrolase [Francisellaceae bacterium]
MIKLIVGLGNPGREYEDTRHNAGEWFIRELADKFNSHFKNDTKFHGETAVFQVAGEKRYLLYPHTYMNRSGQAVAKLANFYKINPDQILIAHDELDLPVGQIRLKKGGGHGGHNGLRSIEADLGSRDFYRLRIGIDHPGAKEQVVGYVLSKPMIKERIAIDQAIARAVDHIDDIVAGKHQRVMNSLHQN